MAMKCTRRAFLRGCGRGLSGLTVAGCSTTSIEPIFAPKAELWDAWSGHGRHPIVSIDHHAWDRLLKAHIASDADGINRFAYARMGPADRRMLDAYIGRLANIPILEHPRNEQLAYWVNLYNALTVRVVIEHYPVHSLRDIDLSFGFLSDGPWDRKLIRIGEHTVSLNDIEHRILRPIWRDPRVHYVVNCAAIGCPNLPPRALTAANADDMMTRAAIEYINHPRGVRVVKNGLVISKIYLWYAEDFGGDPKKIVAHVLGYVRPELAARIPPDVSIVDYEYDWALNDAPNYKS